MQNNVNEFFDSYVTDIENGTLNKDLLIEPEVREVLEKTFKPNPARAAELRALKEKYDDVKEAAKARTEEFEKLCKNT